MKWVVILFIEPRTTDLMLIKEILRIFGEAFRLVTNIGKSSFTPIRSEE
jgi:hypothetical protein